MRCASPALHPNPIVTRAFPGLRNGALGGRMIPSVRSMIIAMVLAVVALSCGFGVFAAFRVNHEPLARLPATATPFQYVADNAAPPAVTFAAGQSFGSRFQLSEAMIAGAAAGITRTPDSTDGGPPSAAATG